jgi:predicted pyridoxine 5'-phosphate oxidase superfamily flavin-nucleotide-binding protein
MAQYASDVAFSSSVKAEQEKRGSREQYHRVETGHGWAREVTPDLAQFIAGMRSFYLATASAEGQPYVQHRGGPTGFLKPIDEHTLAFADFRGNRQYITAGNLAENPRAYIFLMDYARRVRVKLWGEAKIVEDDPALLARLVDPEYRAVPERAIVFTLKAWDRNCPQHIPQLVPLPDAAAALSVLEQRVADLETENASLKATLQSRA